MKKSGNGTISIYLLSEIIYVSIIIKNSNQKEHYLVIPLFLLLSKDELVQLVRMLIELVKKAINGLQEQLFIQ